MRICGVKSFSLNNGYGVRYVIFTQGCDHHCVGCQNPETWDFGGGRGVAVEEIANWIIQHEKHHRLLDGITLSGGDPFYQQEECVKLIKLLPDYMDVWIYTGFLYDEIKDTELATLADYIVDGPFDINLKVDGELYGSSNQHIIDVKKELNSAHRHYLG